MDQPNINPSEQNTNREPVISPNSSNLTNKSNSFPKILIVILLFFLFLGLGIFLAKTYFSPQNSITAIPTIAPIIPPADPTVDWKTYTNLTYKFKLNYPPTLKVSSGGDFAADLVDQTVNQKDINPFSDIKVRISVNQISRNFDKIYSAPNNAVISEEQGALDAIFTKIRNRMIGEYKAVDYTYNVPGNQTEKSFTKGTIINKNGTLIEISTWDSNLTYFDQILYTFKFTDQTETSGTENWKTYSNTKFGFEFLYPSNLVVSGDDLGEQGYITTKNNNHINIRIVQDNSPTIADYLVKTDKISQTSYEGKPSLEVQSTKKTVINNLNCIQRKEYLNAADITQTTTYFKSKSTVVILTLSPIPGNPLLEDENLYNQILSTFKFTQ